MNQEKKKEKIGLAKLAFVSNSFSKKVFADFWIELLYIIHAHAAT
jgi:hypothetical protein